ncbi:hypothetical protein HYV81_02610 [Candidatus Woesearchaeota archaeon]|nr:hypothetical protein [Candidatus Woesearchaeota archaeon]
MGYKTVSVLALSLVLLVGIVAAHGMYGRSPGFGIGSGMDGMGMGMGYFHEEVEEVLEEGSYQDLVALRQELGANIMPWVDTEEEFKAMQERHKAMEAWYEKNNQTPGYGCPMMR